MEKLYLVCRDCGEAFDQLVTAKDHESKNGCGVEEAYDIFPESIAL